MKLKAHNRKGYSTIELLMALTILCIVLFPLYTYFFYHYRCFIQAEEELEVQYHVQIAMEELIDNLIYTKGIQQIAFYDAAHSHVKKIIFDNSAQGDLAKKRLVIEHKRNFKSLWYGYGNEANVIYANDIDLIQIEPIEGTYQNCRGIRIYLVGSRRSTKCKAENEIYFRNY